MPRVVRPLLLPLLICLALVVWLFVSRTDDQGTARSYGLETRIPATAYLNMPSNAGGEFPPLLSQTGVFSDVSALKTEAALIPYDLVLGFWSDGAIKSRWVAIPEGKVDFAATGEWDWPDGTVFVKHFDLPVDDARPGITRRLETRLLVRDEQGSVYGATYKWRPDNSDADLLSGSLTEQIDIKTASGTRQQSWYYPSREDCLECHSSNAGGALGLKTRQLNRDITYPSGITDNQLRAWNHIGLFSPAINEQDIPLLPKLATADDPTRTLEDKARSYLDANCSHCHRPGGAAANFDARYDTPLDQQNLVNGPVMIDQNIDKARVIVAKDIWRSIAHMRMNTNEGIKMPPLARNTIDHQGVELLESWINSLDGSPTVAPPAIIPEGGAFSEPVQITINEAEPGAQIHYTLDGSVPTTSDPLYEGPITLAATAVVRARAYKDGYTRSIPVKQIFIVNAE